MNFKSCLFFTLFFAAACSVPNLPASMNYQGYKVDAKVKPDTALTNLLQPYSASIRNIMSEVIGFSNSNMYKAQPESVLGNFMADCMLTMAAQKFNQPVDIAFMNQGGIRSDINRGNVTMASMYELMPFDNLLILQQVKGTVLEQFIQLVAADGGWPISKGSSFRIKSKKAVDIIINGKPIDLNATYTIANTDYIANGGSNASMFKGLPIQNIGYLLRDALADYTKQLTKAGKPVDGQLENRVTIINE